MKYRGVFCFLVLFVCVFGVASAEGWSTWRGDVARSGSSEELLPATLRTAWVYNTGHAPTPILRTPRGTAKEGGIGKALVPSFTADLSFQMVSSEGRVFFASSVEESVCCLDAVTGALRWTFYAEGAVRFAPVLFGEQVYFGSDDGFVYCLNAANGSLVWKFQTAPTPRRIIASKHFSSQWPVRGGVTVQNGILYAACGIFPEEDRGVLLYALNAVDGSVVYNVPLKIHAMGHLLIEDESLIIPAGRAAPLDVLLETGRRPDYKFVTRRDEGGGSPCLVGDLLVYGPNENGILKVRSQKKTPKGKGNAKYGTSRIPGAVSGIAGWRMVADDSHYYLLRDDSILALEQKPFVRSLTDSAIRFATKSHKVFLKRHQQSREDPILMEELPQQTKWTAQNDFGAVSMIRAGNQIVLGGQDAVKAFSTTDGALLWSVPVDGKVWDLAVNDGSVFASTDQGAVICLRADGQGADLLSKRSVDSFADEKQVAYREHVRQALEKADTLKGYCLIAGIEDGRLAYEVAKQSELFVLGLAGTAEKANAARKRLADAGLYGDRVVIHQVDFQALDYLDHFANVILSETAFQHGTIPNLPAIIPMLQPYGGVIAVGGNADVSKGWKKDNGLGYFQQPALDNAGEWTHMFADTANTLCSGDTLVKGTKYDIQWIGPPGSENQYGWHNNSMSDLFKDGKLYYLGADSAAAIDAYNGTELWKIEVPGSLRLGVGHESGQACVDSDFLYVAATNDCWLLDVNSGQKVAAYKTPDGGLDWGYIAIVDDQLFGSQQSPEATYNIQGTGGRKRTVWGNKSNTQVMSRGLFSLSKASGKQRWLYSEASQILNSSITIADGIIYFVENRDADLPSQDVGITHLDEFFEKESWLVALDAKTGAQKWRIPFTSEAEEMFYLSYSKGSLLCVASANEPFGGATELDKMKNYYELTVLNAADGSQRWSRSIVAGKETYKHNVNIQPAVIMGDTIYLSMRTGGRLFTFNLSDGKGEEIPKFRGSKGCGVMTASATTLFFRNMVSEAYDTVSKKTFFTSSISRPSCWLNGLPVGGLMLMPEATTGCDCAFALQVSIVLAPQK